MAWFRQPLRKHKGGGFQSTNVKIPAQGKVPPLRKGGEKMKVKPCKPTIAISAALQSSCIVSCFAIYYDRQKPFITCLICSEECLLVLRNNCLLQILMRKCPVKLCRYKLRSLIFCRNKNKYFSALHVLKLKVIYQFVIIYLVRYFVVISFK